MTAVGAGGGAAAAAAVAQAIKASGAIVQLEPLEFERILNRVEAPLVVQATAGFSKKNIRYLTGYRGFIFSTKTTRRLSMPSGAEVVWAKKIWTP